MTRGKSTYKPQDPQRAILARAMEFVKSVNYRVGLRWVFYRLLQEGWYKSKDDYKHKLEPLLSAARHAFYEDWRPDTLTDETRSAIHRGHGSTTSGDWISNLAKEITCTLAKWHNQPCYIQLWYEARAMTEQFEYYTEHIDLVPMGGQPSIDYKWQIAKFLERAAAVYQKPIIILYFGDLDDAGKNISKRVDMDVRKWCEVDFTFIHCGLTLEQVAQYNVPENPDKPGQYQWEALTDDAAREIITSNVDRFISHDGFSEIASQESAATDWIRAKLAEIAANYP